MADFTHNNLDDIIQEFVYPTPVHATPNLRGLLSTVVSENRRIDLDIESLYDDRFIDTATGRELEKMAFEVGVRRNTDEGDDSLRRRVFGQYAAQSSNATYDNFATAALNILDADSSDIELTTPPNTSNPKTVLVGVDGAAFTDSPLSNTQIKSLLEESNSAGAAVELTITGTFAFDSSDTSFEGWDNGTWSDIVD